MSFLPSRPRPARSVARGIGGGTAALAALALLAGCGGDGGGSSSTAATSASTTASALSHADLVRRANAACASAESEISAIQPATSLTALADYATQVHDVGARLHDQLSALTPSAADSTAYTKYVAGVAASNNALDAMADAARARDRSGVRAAARSIDDVAVGVLATRAGLPGCAATTTAGSAS